MQCMNVPYPTIPSIAHHLVILTTWNTIIMVLLLRIHMNLICSITLSMITCVVRCLHSRLIILIRPSQFCPVILHTVITLLLVNLFPCPRLSSSARLNPLPHLPRHADANQQQIPTKSDPLKSSCVRFPTAEKHFRAFTI